VKEEFQTYSPERGRTGRLTCGAQNSEKRTPIEGNTCWVTLFLGGGKKNHAGVERAAAVGVKESKPLKKRRKKRKGSPAGGYLKTNKNRGRKKETYKADHQVHVLLGKGGGGGRHSQS